MFLNKKKKPDNKGVALASVLLITAFVMVITSSVLSMAYNTYRMKLINVSSKDNLYACEAVLEQVRVGFRNQFSEITEELTETTSTTIASAFEEFYADYKLDGYMVDNNYLVGDSKSGKGIYYYDVYKVAQLLTSITGTNNSTVVVTADNPYASLDYDGTTPVFTSSVEITVDNSDYNNITVTLQANATGKNNFELTDTSVTFHDLTVIYSENGYESEVTTDITIEFPEVETSSGGSGSSGNVGGWVSLDDNRVKTYGDWETAFATEEYAAYDFGTVVDTASDRVYVNTTDYPANTVSYISFDMRRYYETTGTTQWDGTTWYDEAIECYEYTPIKPWVQVQDGKGTGGQYAACGSTSGYTNVEIFIGPEGEEDNDDYWVKYTDVFDENNNWYVKEYTDGDYTSAVYKYILKYGDDLQSSTDYYTSGYEIPVITYRVHLVDLNGMENSRGWIEVLGTNNNEQPVLDSVQIYVDIDDELSDPKCYFLKHDDDEGIVGTNVNEGMYGDNPNSTWNSNFLFVDISESNYNVGDILHITIHNVDPTAYQNASPTAWKDYYSIGEQVATAYDRNNTQSYHTLYAVNEVTYAECTVDFEDGNEEIYITMSWDLYPYLVIQISGATDQLTVETEWNSGSTGTSSTTTSTAGDASIYYEDWRKE